MGVRRSWRAGADCKSVGLSLRWFESTHSHQNINTRQTAGIYILSCGIWIRPYNRQIVWFGTSASARSERGPPQCIAVGITIHPLPPKHKPTRWSVFILCWSGEMRTTGSTMSRFDKHRAVKSSGMPHIRRDNAVRGNPAAHQNTNRRE